VTRCEERAPAPRYVGPGSDGATAVIRVLNQWLLVASAALAAVCFWNRNDLPGDIAFRAELLDPPRQTPTARGPFSVDYAGVKYAVKPEFAYDLYGMVVSYRQHDGESLMHRRANDHLNVADLCVVWSDTASSPTLGEIDFWNGIFTCNFETRDADAWSHFDVREISNNHLITADDTIRDEIATVRIGDQVHIRGWLASYGSGAGKRGTSTTRDDTGNGACETIYVDDFEVLARTLGGWRVTLYAALAVLALTIITYFSLPYRPYD
jgi:hypothetical protein